MIIKFESCCVEFQRPFQVDNFTNGPGYYQQLPMPNLRQDFIPDMSKLDISWDSTRPLNDLQDKHVSAILIHILGLLLVKMGGWFSFELQSWTNQWNK